jgi:hypothetical protein
VASSVKNFVDRNPLPPGRGGGQYGLVPQCEEKLKAIKKQLTYAVQELEDIDYIDLLLSLKEEDSYRQSS